MYSGPMPITLPAHPAAVLPLKLLWPSRVDGVAVVMGSIAPDLAYAFMPGWSVDSHGWLSVAYWSLPVALILTFVVRRLVLPAAGIFPTSVRSTRVTSPSVRGCGTRFRSPCAR